MRASAVAGLLLMSATCALSCGSQVDPGASIRFVDKGKTLKSLSLGELQAAIPSEEWRAFDPYYEREKGWRTLPLHPVLEAGFERPVSELHELEFILRATDGYTVPISGRRLLELGAYIAFEDLDVAAWEPIGTQKAHPGPFYVVWRGPDQQSLKDYPRPWQLAAIEVADFKTLFPHTIPTGHADDSVAMMGFRLFKKECLKCHAINQQGGHVGPELNVPQSIVEYRPEAQIKAYIKNPATFRYGGMPAHPHLSEHDLDALVAYLRVMSQQKHDPHTSGQSGSAAGSGGAP